MNVKFFVYGVFIILICSGLYTGSSLYESDINSGTSRDFYNFTFNAVKWNSSKFPLQEYNVSNNESMVSVRIHNLMAKNVDAIGYSFMEGMKFIIEIGYYSQGKYDLGFMLTLMKFIMWIIVIGIIFYPAAIIGMGIYELVKYVMKLIRNRIKEEIRNRIEEE
jgi:hypothetical protein